MLAFLVLIAGVLASAVEAADFEVGLFSDGAHQDACIAGTIDSVFEQFAWAWIPDDLGAIYVTLRLKIPENISAYTRPVFHDQVVDVIYTDFTDGTQEWNIFLESCPSGWVQLYRQEWMLLDEKATQFAIIDAHSMVRDCTFTLNWVAEASDLLINDPTCSSVTNQTTTWTCIKSSY